MKIDLRNCDCMELMATLEDKSQHLIIVDPPYFEVKGKFDFIWSSFEDYLKDVEKWAIEIKRVMADNGTLFWWGNDRKIAYSQIILDKHFNLENSLIWEKCDSMQYQYYSPEMARRFNTHNERILCYSNGTEPEEWDKTGLERVMEEHINPKSPIAKYLRDEFKRAKVTNKEIAKLFPSKTGGLTGCVSNWLNGQNVITEEQYLTIREHLNGEYLRKEYEYLRKEYEELRKEYEELRKEYEELRRPFNNYMKLTDVLKFSQQAHITGRWKHPTMKPPKLCASLIRTCSRKGMNMLVPFGGSGSECIEGFHAGLNVVSSELDKEYYEMAQQRITEETAQLSFM
ncbi:MAG: site-specific DNA-methyltransferase [Desulfobulbaceae bacterium]|nr:site-specific DNA-methyltransferase [Desulfobulbaceae bacterium]